MSPFGTQHTPVIIDLRGAGQVILGLTDRRRDAVDI
jgi:hypothetical protein